MITLNKTYLECLAECLGDVELDLAPVPPFAGVIEAATDAGVVRAGVRVHSAAVALFFGVVVVVVVVEGAQRVRHRRARRDEVSVDVELDALRDCEILDSRELLVAQRLRRRCVGVVFVVGEAAIEAHVRMLVRLVGQTARALSGRDELHELGRVVVKQQVAHRKGVRYLGNMNRAKLISSQFLASLGSSLGITGLTLIYS
jgi:hypothetical protein